MRPLRHVALVLAGLVALGALVYAGAQLWDTSVPGDLSPPELDAAREIPAGALEDAESFSAVMRWLEVLSQITLLVVLALYARRGAALARLSAAGPIGTGFLLGMLGLALVWLAQLPFRIIEQWWGRKHDLIETSWLESLLGDWLALGGQFVFLCFALLVAMGLARLLRLTWWVPAAGVFAGLTLAFAFVVPWLLVVDDDPPGNQWLTREARQIAAREGVRGVPLRVEDVRDVTTTPNAYAVGLGASRRVVLWNTITDFPRPQVQVVIAHEYAHHKHRHILKTIGWYALLILPTGAIVAVFTRRRGGLGAPQAVPVALLVVTLVGLATAPLERAVSQRYEAEADWTALETTRDPEAMAALFVGFSEEGLADPDPPGWYRALFDDHPSTLERIAMARAWAARNP